jgi:hypothetical protein
MVVDRAHAATQLCAPVSWPLLSPPIPATAGTPCEEGERYRCADGLVVECGLNAAFAQCEKGCIGEGASLEYDGVSREAAFAMLCAR